METTFTESQIKTINTEHPMLLCLANAGSGKSSTLCARIKRLLADGVDFRKIVAITFTVAAARNLLEKLGTPLGYCGTLHSFLLRLLNEKGFMVGLQPNITVLNEADTKELFDLMLRQSKVKTVSVGEQAIADWKFGEAKTSAEIFAYQWYEKLRKGNMLSYDAILKFGLELLKQWRPPIEHLLVDEVQDSSGLDMAIYREVKALNMFYVGDSDQAIYAFRGGDVEQIMAVSRDAGTKILKLEENWRSGSRICELANRLIEFNKNRFPKQTVSAVGFEGEIMFKTFASADQELGTLILELLQLNVSDPDVLNDTAILCRSNALVEFYAKGLKAAGIPVKERQQKVWPDDWSRTTLLLSLLVNPRNDYLAYKWLEISKGKAVADQVRIEAAKNRTSLNATYLKFGMDMALGDVLTEIRSQGASMESESLLRDTVATLTSDATPQDLILALRDGTERLEKGFGVSATTIHASKGREWSRVYLPALEQEVIPGKRVDMNVPEERRILFVGITRAKRYLWLSWAQSRPPLYYPGLPKRTEPSQFLTEMGYL